MLTIEEIRRIRLAQLVREYGSQAELAREINKDKNQVGQWLGRANSRSISSETARDIELVCQKPRGWMDNLPIAKVGKLPSVIENDTSLIKALKEHIDATLIEYAELRIELGQRTPANPFGKIDHFAGLLADEVEMLREQEELARLVQERRSASGKLSTKTK
ncbi:hypothetical protein [Xanthomonas albilineans]|uniref:Uncharacterized protein n=1 Tax=Xanthomonas albilineans (strain GPE PC73 / CFBP 7063) TaxID=380358 RepID=D2U933_XANAP|nr:hypothetical protein [Xanthomonas albilineans]CBA14736.1 hypothetical protein XALC_0191 [Xanthomonas albilineans GPE PC73]